MTDCKHTGCCRERTGQCGGCRARRLPSLTEAEQGFMRQLGQMPFLPVARFLLKSGKSSHLESVALAPVYLTSKNDTAESVRAVSETLKNLEEYGLITLDYELPLSNSDDALFRESDAYAEFQDVVAEGAMNPAFLFDISALEIGSLALTGLGQAYLDGEM